VVGGNKAIKRRGLTLPTEGELEHAPKEKMPGKGLTHLYTAPVGEELAKSGLESSDACKLVHQEGKGH